MKGVSVPPEDSDFQWSKGFAELPAGRQGSQSVVSVRGRRDGARVLKRAALGRGLTLHEANAAVANLSAYRDELAFSDWNIPAVAETTVVGSGNAVEVWAIEQYIPGGDIATLGFRDSRIRKALLQVVNAVSLVASQLPLTAVDNVTTLSMMPYGIDLKPSNIIVHPRTGLAYLVDTFPPLNFAENGSFAFYNSKVHRFSESMLMAVCATREGSILRFWRLLERQWNLGAADTLTMRQMLAEVLEESPMPHASVEIILGQIETNYPMLDLYYAGALPSGAA
ncbi:hypothetical protein AB0M83_19115 [Amycolatopsis sp. NPDC051106]|uniref:hypothetical protein n=1 Tax=unclassified Amycolatopsis TaxID=2618356 RepID=UPI00343F9759